MKTKKDLLQELKRAGGVYKIKSDSSNKVYKLEVVESKFNKNRGDYILRCSCPSWKYNNSKYGDRVCKHIHSFLKMNVHPNTRRELAKGLDGGLKK